MEIKEVSCFEFLFLYSDKYPNILIYYSMRLGKDGRVYLLLDNGIDIGAAALSKVTNTEFELTYIYIESGFRNQKAGSFFINAIRQQLRQINCNAISARTVLNEENISGIFNHLGFTAVGESVITKFKVDYENEQIWRKYISRKRNAVCKWNKLNNIRVIPFSSADKNTKDIIFNRKNNDFPKELDPVSISEGSCGNFAEEMSYIACKDKVPITYTMLSSPSKNTLVFSQISTSKNYQGTGAFIVPFIASMDSIFASGYEIVSYTILKNNARMMKIFQTALGLLDHTTKRQIYWKMNLVEKINGE